MVHYNLKIMGCTQATLTKKPLKFEKPLISTEDHWQTILIVNCQEGNLNLAREIWQQHNNHEVALPLY
jgi:hypothetical protein